MPENVMEGPRTYDELFALLAAPFTGPNEVKYRTQAGRELAYVTARTVMIRLDEVVGPANWWDTYQATPNGAFCNLSIRLSSSDIITKSDIGGNAEMPDDGDNEKAGVSDAFKRAAAKFGVGRYLYRDGVPNFVKATLGIGDLGEFEPRARGGGGGYQSQRRDDPPPQNGGSRTASNGGGQQGGNGGDGNLPRSSKALFPWVKGLEENHPGFEILNRVNKYGKAKGWPYKMTEYDDAQTRETIALAQKALADYLGTPSSPSGGQPQAEQRPMAREYNPANVKADEDIPF